MDRTWTIVGVGGSPGVTSSGSPGKGDRAGPCEQPDGLSLFNSLRTMWQKELKSMDRPHRPHPVGTTRSPQGCGRHPGVTDRPYNPIQEVERFSCLLWVAGRVGEEQLNYSLSRLETRESGRDEEGKGQ